MPHVRVAPQCIDHPSQRPGKENLACPEENQKGSVTLSDRQIAIRAGGLLPGLSENPQPRIAQCPQQLRDSVERAIVDDKEFERNALLHQHAFQGFPDGFQGTATAQTENDFRSHGLDS